MTLAPLCEREAHGLRLRAVPLVCPGCGEVHASIVLASHDGEDRWFSFANTTEGVDPEEAVEWIAEQPLADEDYRYAVAQGIGAFGLPWAEIDRDALLTQLDLIDSAPRWLADELRDADPEHLAGLREAVEDIEDVPPALAALRLYRGNN